jgi:hypothetical protein
MSQTGRKQEKKETEGKKWRTDRNQRKHDKSPNLGLKNHYPLKESLLEIIKIGHSRQDAVG